MFVCLFVFRQKIMVWTNGKEPDPKIAYSSHSWVLRGSSMLTEIIFVLLGVYFGVDTNV